MTSLLITGLLVCYIASIAGLNLIGCLISAFYQRKFEPSPTAGFIIAIVASVLVIVCAVIPGSASLTVKIVQIILLWTAGVASGWNSYGLFKTLRKVRK
jgi:LytS/YehU family sensor histidine kinase